MFTRSPGFDLGEEGGEVMALDSGLGRDLTGRQDGEFGNVRSQTKVEPSKRSTEKEVAAANPTIVKKVKARATLPDHGDGGGFDGVREMRVGNLVVEELENERESHVREVLDEPLFPAVRTRGRASIAFA